MTTTTTSISLHIEPYRYRIDEYYIKYYGCLILNCIASSFFVLRQHCERADCLLLYSSLLWYATDDSMHYIPTSR